MIHIVEDGTRTKQELLVRMERNNATIQRLSKKLGSYTYEPKCPSDFERFNTLKNGFKIFSRHQKEIMDLIKSTKYSCVMMTNLINDLLDNAKLEN